MEADEIAKRRCQHMISIAITTAYHAICSTLSEDALYGLGYGRRLSMSRRPSQGQNPIS